MVIHGDGDIKSLLERFESISRFIELYSDFHSKEVIDLYPDQLNLYPEPWIRSIVNLREDQLKSLFNQTDFSFIQDKDLLNYLDQIKTFSTLPPRREARSTYFSPKYFHRVKGKKRHELEVLGGVVSKLIETYDLNEVLDITGGQGFLAQFLSQHFQIETLSIDIDRSLQEKGTRRDIARCRRVGSKLSFLEADLNDPDLITILGERVTNKVLNIGLHTCGSLSVNHMRIHCELGAKVLLNFPCCYYRTELSDLNLSTVSKKQNIHLSIEVRTLASRGHIFPRNDIFLWRRVKEYRYLMHLYLFHLHDLKQRVTLGNSPKRLYIGDFTEYADEQLKRLNIKTQNGTKDCLRKFSQDLQQQKKIKEMLAADVIRALLGRVCELFLIIDRALFLEEQGQEVSIHEYFVEAISPRNIGILARPQ